MSDLGYSMVLQIARKIAKQEHWTWLDPISVQRKRKYLFFGSRYWQIRTNINGRGCNIFITIDDQTGQVIEKMYLPR